MAEEGNKLAKSALRASYLSSVVSISLVLFMAGIMGVMILNAKRISDYFKESLRVSVFLQPDADLNDAKQLAHKISSEEGIKSAILISKDEAAKKLSEDLGEDFVSFIGTNPLSHSIEVSFLSEHAHAGKIQKFSEEYKKNKLIHDVRYEQSLVENINDNIRKLSVFILGFCALLVFIMGVLINNTIRLTLYAKRFLIKSMQLVGATRGFIRKPFLWKGMQSGFYGAVIANILLVVLLFFAQNQIPELFGLHDLMLMLTLMSGVILTGIIISVTSTWFAVNKYLRKSYEELF